MPVPSLMREVTAAAYARTGIGSMSSASGGSGDGGACGSIEDRVLTDPDRVVPQLLCRARDLGNTFGVGEPAGPDTEPADREHRLRGLRVALTPGLRTPDVGHQVDDERERSR